jgi:hypothetical protein
MNRPPLPPQSANHHWENAVRRTDSFSSVSNPTPSGYPNNVNHQKPFIDQTQASAMSPIQRRPVPLPGTLPNQPASRNMSASVFNLSHGGYPQQQAFQQQQPNPWGMNAMSQVSETFD